MKVPLNPAQEGNRLLLLVRHGKAVPQNIGLSDFERILTRTGLEESERMAAQTKAMLQSVDLMLSSPADRALETAHVFARHLKCPVQKIRIVEMVYSAGSIQPLIRYIRRLENSKRTVAIFGHNPLFDELAAYWIRGFSRTIPKSAVLGIEFKAPSWDCISRGKGRLLFFMKPSKKDTQSGPCSLSAGKQDNVL